MLEPWVLIIRSQEHLRAQEH